MRDKAYNAAPESERNADRDRNGRPLVIDLISVEGKLAGLRVELFLNGS